MTLTVEETREWYLIQGHVREAVMQLEMCSRCWRIRELTKLICVRGTYCCRPGDPQGCLAH